MQVVKLGGKKRSANSFCNGQREREAKTRSSEELERRHGYVVDPRMVNSRISCLQSFGFGIITIKNESSSGMANGKYNLFLSRPLPSLLLDGTRYEISLVVSPASS